MKTSRFFFVGTGMIAVAIMGAPLWAAPQSTKDVQEISNAFADCVVKEDAVKAREIVLFDPVGRHSDKFSNVLVECLGRTSDKRGGRVGQMTFPSPSLPYALARVIVRAEFGKEGVPSFQLVPPLKHPDMPVLDEAKLPSNKRKADKVRADHEKAVAKILMARFGECSVRSNPEAARKLIVSEAATPERIQAVADIKPILGVCLGKGTVTLNTFNLTGALAVAYVRLADQAAQTATSASQNGTNS